MRAVRLRIGVRAFRQRMGFTLVELVVCIGVLMIVLGIAMPSLSKARQASRRTAALISARTSIQAVAGYQQQSNDFFPVQGNSLGRAMLDWAQPLVGTGHFTGVVEAEPAQQGAAASSLWSMSGACFATDESMTSGSVLPMGLTPLTPRRGAAVRDPSRKGILAQWLHRIDGQPVFWTWQPGNGPLSPLAMADGSAMQARSSQFRIEPANFEHWVGHPVLASWRGLSGSDMLVSP